MSDRIEIIHTAERDPNVNLPYAPAVKVKGGSLLFLAGVNAAKVYHSHPHIESEFDDIPSDMEGQTRMALENVRKGLGGLRRHLQRRSAGDTVPD